MSSSNGWEQTAAETESNNRPRQGRGARLAPRTTARPRRRGAAMGFCDQACSATYTHAHASLGLQGKKEMLTSVELSCPASSEQLAGTMDSIVVGLPPVRVGCTPCRLRTPPFTTSYATWSKRRTSSTCPRCGSGACPLQPGGGRG